MTKREKKYHKRKWWGRWLRRMMGLSSEELAAVIRVRKERLNYYAMKNGTVIAKAFGSTTITISKYNLPNNSSLQKGQLN